MDAHEKVADEAELMAAAEAHAAAWARAEGLIARIVVKAGGRLIAEIGLPAPISDTWRTADRKTLPRQFSKALVEISKSRGFGDAFEWRIRFGVASKNGIFFPEPNDHGARIQIDNFKNFRDFVTWFGGVDKFLKTVLVNATNCAESEDEVDEVDDESLSV